MGCRSALCERYSSLCYVILNMLISTALRAMKEAALTWGDVHDRYLSAAIHFADDFHGWTGFPHTGRMK